MKRGIYLVANLNSQSFCENLIYSIRQSGCTLPIRLIHFGGKKVDSPYILQSVEYLEAGSFSKEALDFVSNLKEVLTECPDGFLYRFLSWFGDWEEFIYSDNDVVALSNWEALFTHMEEGGYDVVHADEEYITKGIFNHYQPAAVTAAFGPDALEKALTAGHFAARRSRKLVGDMQDAVAWFKAHPGIPKKHDQALMHIASLLGNWKMLNLCKPPHNWLSSWAGDYKNPLALVQAVQPTGGFRKISHLHYSGSTPTGRRPIDDLLFSYLEGEQRINTLMQVWVQKILHVREVRSYRKKIAQRVKKWL